MKTKFQTMRRVLLATALVLVAATSGALASPNAETPPIIPTTPTCTVTLVSGNPDTAPPAPTCYDPSGKDLDEFLSPYFVDASGNRVSYDDINGNLYWYDRPNSTNGAGQVLVQSSHYDPGVGGYVDGPAWTLTFNTSVTATPTPNSYWVTIGGCEGSTSDWLRDVTVYVRNNAGEDGRYYGSVYPEATGHNGGISVAGTQTIYRLYDGETAGIPLIIDDYTPGLKPGFTYKIKVWLTDKVPIRDQQFPRRTLGASLSVRVPKCGRPAGSTARQRASIQVIERLPQFSSVKVVLGNTKATHPTGYRIVIDPKQGATVRRTFRVKHKVLRYDQIRNGTLIEVRFGDRVVRKRI